MSEMIAYCGLDCNECRAFKATQSKDIEWKRQIAKHLSDQGEIKFKPKDVNCNGCKSDIISARAASLRSFYRNHDGDTLPFDSLKGGKHFIQSRRKKVRTLVFKKL